MIQQQNCSGNNLNHNDVFFVINNKDAFFWEGAGANEWEINLAKEMQGY